MMPCLCVDITYQTTAVPPPPPRRDEPSNLDAHLLQRRDLGVCGVELPFQAGILGVQCVLFIVGCVAVAGGVGKLHAAAPSALVALRPPIVLGTKTLRAVAQLVRREELDDPAAAGARAPS
jgi:hypothetical protein